jgi:hypothetical protein
VYQAGDNKIMCRIDPAIHEEAIKRKACETVKMRGREYKGFVYVSEEGIKTKRILTIGSSLQLEFNKLAKSSKKKKK